MDNFLPNRATIEELIAKKPALLNQRNLLYAQLLEIEESQGTSYLKKLRINELHARIEAENATLKMISYLEKIFLNSQSVDQKSIPAKRQLTLIVNRQA